jgi:hypothetical protein
MRALIALAAAAAVATPVSAQEDFDLSDWGVWAAFGYASFGCYDYNGDRVRIVADRSIDNIGYALRHEGRSYIVMNPDVASEYSPVVNWWWFGHECGHRALPPGRNGEQAADCWAIKVMRDRGFLIRDSLLDLNEELYALQGSDLGHLPGPDRIALINDCFFDNEYSDPDRWPGLDGFRYDPRDIDQLIADTSLPE